MSELLVIRAVAKNHGFLNLADYTFNTLYNYPPTTNTSKGPSLQRMRGVSVRINYAIVFVSNMNRSISFYRDVVGLSLKFESPEWTEFSTEGATLALHQSDQPNPDEHDQHRVSAGRSPGVLPRHSQCTDIVRIRNRASGVGRNAWTCLR